MSWLVIVCGALLAIGGGISIVSGAPYMQIEFGWTEVIAGASALAGGVVTMALGAVLLRLGALHKTLRSGAAQAMTPLAYQTADGPATLPPLAPVIAEPPAFEAAPPPSEPPVAAPQPSRFSSLKERFARRPSPDLSTVPSTESRFAEPGPASADAPPSLHVTDSAPPVQASIEGVTEDRLDPAPSTEPFRRVGIEATGGPEVVGRYESGGASYVLFADGTIEVETSTGTHHFASMDELKAFIERQEAEKAALDI